MIVEGEDKETELKRLKKNNYKKTTTNKQLKKHKQLKDILESIPKAPKITKIDSSRKSYYMNFDVEILDEHDAQLQLKNTESSISNFLLDTLKHEIKLIVTLQITFTKHGQDVFFKTIPKEITNELDIGDVLSESSNELLNRISDWVSKGGG